MPRTLIRKNPSNFKTLPLFVEATPENLTYQSVGMPMNFAQTLQRRRKIEVPDTERFATELANLGVSVRLTVSWQNRDYWVLVRQRRQDRGDVVLKLISGYVPAHELSLPLHTADSGSGRRVPDRNAPRLAQRAFQREAMPFRLSPLSGAARPVRSGNLTLLERPRAYVHLPTASLQLIYDMRLEIPKEARPVSLFHVDEALENDQLVARLNRSKPDLYLMPLENGSPLPELYTLKRDKLIPAPTRGLYLAESFAAQDGWVVREERIRWKDWLRQQGMTPPPKKTGLKRLTGKARELLHAISGKL